MGRPRSLLSRRRRCRELRDLIEPRFRVGNALVTEQQVMRGVEFERCFVRRNPQGNRITPRLKRRRQKRLLERHRLAGLKLREIHMRQRSAHVVLALRIVKREIYCSFFGNLRVVSLVNVNFTCMWLSSEGSNEIRARFSTTRGVVLSCEGMEVTE